MRMKKAGGTLYTTALELGQWPGIRDKGRETLTKLAAALRSSSRRPLRSRERTQGKAMLRKTLEEKRV